MEYALKFFNAFNIFIIKKILKTHWYMVTYVYYLTQF